MSKRKTRHKSTGSLFFKFATFVRWKLVFQSHYRLCENIELLRATDLVFAPLSLSSLSGYINKIIRYISFYICILPLGKMLLRFIFVTVISIISLFLCIADKSTLFKSKKSLLK